MAHDGLTHPRCTTLPMGFKPSPAVAQASHEAILYGKKGDGSALARDLPPVLDPAERWSSERSPGPDARSAHALVQDDLLLFTMVPPGSPGPGGGQLATILERYAAVDLTVKPGKVKQFATRQQGLGYSLDQNVWACTADKYAALQGAVLGLCARGWAFPREVERIVGQFTNIFLLHRPALSVFSCVYVFSRRLGERLAKVWPVVLRELRAALAILPLVCADVSRPVSPLLVQVDACPKGGAVVYTRTVPTRDLQHECTRPRPRFTDWNADGAPPRMAAAATMRSGFEATLDPGFWEVSLRRRFTSGGHINEREAQMVVDALRWFTRTVGNFSTRVVIESDSLVTVCAIRKGRSSKPGMLKHCRRLAAMTLAAGVSVELRWVPTGRNMADQPSRGGLVPGPCTAG